MRMAGKLGLLEQSGTHQQFISLKRVCEVLFPDAARYFNNVRFYAGFEKKPDFKGYYERIKYALAKCNFKQQQFKIDKNSSIQSIGTNRENVVNGKKLIALMKRYKVSSVRALKSIVQRVEYIVTGKNHIARLIGCSASTGSKLLKKWHSKGLFKREMVKALFKSDLNHSTFEVLKSMGNKFIVPHSEGAGFWINKGSKITLTT